MGCRIHYHKYTISVVSNFFYCARRRNNGSPAKSCRCLKGILGRIAHHKSDAKHTQQIKWRSNGPLLLCHHWNHWAIDGKQCWTIVKMSYLRTFLLARQNTRCQQIANTGPALLEKSQSQQSSDTTPTRTGHINPNSKKNA